MSKTTPAVSAVKARALVTPMARPVKNAFGVIDAAPLVLIDIATDQGITGHSYLFAYSKVTLKPFVHLLEEIGRELIGRPVAPFELMKFMDAKFRLLGWQGLVGMAVSGLDMAFWDILGQAAGKPVVELLGGSPRPIRCYDSYGAVEADADEKALRRSLDQGFRGIKVKGGDGDAANDERRAAWSRHRADARFQPVARSSRSQAPHRAACALRSHLDRGTGAAGKPVGARRGARDLGDPDPGRRELVVPARLRRGDRRRRQRLHHARPDEGRRHHRLAPCRWSSGRSFDPDVEPHPAGGERARACGHAHGALA